METAYFRFTIMGLNRKKLVLKLRPGGKNVKNKSSIGKNTLKRTLEYRQRL
jgi:hypothetical protein